MVVEEGGEGGGGVESADLRRREVKRIERGVAEKPEEGEVVRDFGQRMKAECLEMGKEPAALQFFEPRKVEVEILKLDCEVPQRRGEEGDESCVVAAKILDLDFKSSEARRERPRHPLPVAAQERQHVIPRVPKESKRERLAQGGETEGGEEVSAS